MTLKKLIDNLDYQGIREVLSRNPELADEEIPYDEKNSTKAHPLHRICDGVFSKKYTDEQGVEMAKIFLEQGANVNGNRMEAKKDTPLIAAASLNADKVAILYIDKGANIHHAGCHGGSALHWAAWCGKDKLVSRLIEEGAAINMKCIDFNATPLFWAVHGLKKGERSNRQNQLECVRILVQSGADKNIPNAEGKTIFDLLDDGDADLKEIL
jgi:ankyrin repeat protein